MLSVSSVTSVGQLFLRDVPVLTKLRGLQAWARNDKFSRSMHDSLCFAVDGVQDCRTCAPASRLDMPAPGHVDICKPEGQVRSLSSVWQEANAGDLECRLKSAYMIIPRCIILLYKFTILHSLDNFVPTSNWTYYNDVAYSLLLTSSSMREPSVPFGQPRIVCSCWATGIAV